VLFFSVVHPPESIERARRAAVVAARVAKHRAPYGRGLFENVVYPRQYTAAPAPVRKHIAADPPLLRLRHEHDDAALSILKSADGGINVQEQRYTLGVAYPVGQIDAHGDTVDEQEIERAAWEYMQTPVVGLMHRFGTEGAGRVVESYISRAPTWEMGGQAVNPGDWLLGVIWDEAAWAAIKAGGITGFSMQGWAERE
jgi:hypothetical protein